MTDLLDQMGFASGLSRPEQAALVIGRMAEESPRGARLGTKTELQERCEVSKGTFNEALQILQARGLITLRPGPGGGVFAAEPTPFVRLGNSILALDTADADISRAVRLRDALDPLIVEDALDHSAAADVARMRRSLDEMHEAIEAHDPTAFVRANWDLHSAIARVSPDTVTRTLYLNLLEFIETHTLSVKSSADASLPEYIAERYQLHVDLVDALEARDREAAMRLIHQHSTTAR
ncbi:DNA-binding transcriptional regulator, FadR family [Raineyella antarctica]|uniref:DNA-binding transcriptional regulator, FadR family n=1 Tax=Raineyella antarctica TaxID=1577474 RepID=A0A1G6ICV3_9ACTN|nr:FCD domain-containing protein [Raineyella antarctica]SDC04331.1 DNA-binding transcriptional regulator, FadR family [Raineyella antarctica]